MTASHTPGVVMGGVFLGLFLASLNQTMVSTAMPSIVATMGGLELYSWVFTAYMLTSTVVVPILGKLSDQFGRRPIFLFGLGTFTLGALAAGFAHTMPALVAVRALQGVGAGAILPIAFAIVGDLYPPAERGRVQGLIGAAFGVSSLLGPLLGGFVTDHFGWRWAFWVNVPVGLVAIAYVMATLPPLKREGPPPTLDWAGSTLLVLALTPLLLVASLGGKYLAWTGLPALGCLAAGLLFAGWFWRVERRAPEPIMPPALFGNGIFAVSAAASALTGVLLFGEIMFLPLFAQGVLAMSPTHAGALLTPLMLGMVTGSTLTGRFASDLGRYRRYVLISCALGVVGATGLAGVTWFLPTPLAVALAVFALGCGVGGTFPLFMLAVQNAVPPQQMGSVTALVQFFRSIGGTFGVAAMGAALAIHVDGALAERLPDLAAAARPDPQSLLAPGGPAHLAPPLVDAVRGALGDALGRVFTYGSGVAVLALAVAWRLEDRPLRGHAGPPLQQAGAALAVEEGSVPGMLRPEDEPDLLGLAPGEGGPVEKHAET